MPLKCVPQWEKSADEDENVRPERLPPVLPMLRRFHEAGLVLVTLFALAALGTLIGLGVWQLQRKAWKDGIAARIAARASAAPVDVTRVLGVAENLRTASMPPNHFEETEFTRVEATGRFEHAGERQLNAIHPKFGPGFHIITPLVLADGKRVLVNRGFVPLPLRSPDKRREGQVAGEVTIRGIVRYAERQGRFVPDNRPDRNEWHWRDWQALIGCPPAVPAARCTDKVPLDGEPLKAMQPSQRRALLGFVDMVDSEAPGGWPRAGAARIELYNRHLEYALTWFGIALGLVGVYVAFAWSRLSRREVGVG